MADFTVYETKYEAPDRPEFVGVYSAKSEAQAVNFARYEKYGRRSFRDLGVNMTAIPVKNNQTQEVKMNLFDSLEWNYSKNNRSGSRSNADVSLTVVQYDLEGNSDRARVTSTFRNGASKKISPSGEKIAYAIGFGFIAFKASEEGYRATNNKSKSNFYIQTTVNDKAKVKQLRDMAGDYGLEYDENYCLYYISKGGRK